MVQIKKFVFSPFQENTYVLHNSDKDCIIIDPGCYFPEERTELKEFIKRQDLTPSRLLNTHCHLDHVFGNAFVHREWNLEPEYHALEEDNLQRGPMSAQMYGIPGYEASPTAKKLMKEGDQIHFGGETFDVILMPGHAPGHLAYYCENLNMLISGDVIFDGSIGRTDLPGGNHQQLLDTIREKVFTLPEETVIYNGHGSETTVGREKKSNPFFS